jgi:N-methylhydantoinase A
VNVRLRATGKTPKPEPRRIARHEGDLGSALRDQRAVWFPDSGFVGCSAYDRYRVGAGAVVLGPAIVDEFDSDGVIYPGYTRTVDDEGNLVIERKPATARQQS